MRTIVGNKSLGAEVLKWHSGQSSLLYVVGSSFVAGNPVAISTVLRACKSLAGIGAEDADRLSTKLKSLCEFKPEDAGCYLDSARGYYMGEEIIDIARHNGMTVNPEDEPNTKTDGEYYHELWGEAENYLQQFAPAGYYFGLSEGGDWGLWKAEEE